MSVEAITWALSVKAGSTAKKAILLTLANYADHEGNCWPSYGTIARQCETSRKTVMRRMAEMQVRGLLVKEERHSPNGGRTTNMYRLAIPPSDKLPPPQSQNVPTPVPDDGTTPVPLLGLINEPSFEPSLKSISNGAHAPPQIQQKALEKKKRAKPFPDDWIPEPKDNDVGIELGMSLAELETEFDRMADWARGKGECKIDWAATWRNWQRKAAERKAANGKGSF